MRKSLFAANIIIFIINTFLIVISARAGENTEEIAIQKVNHEIRIDGKIEEGEWEGVNYYDNFYEIEPGDNKVPEERTKFWIAYDQQHLYLAFYCYESDISKLRYSMVDRDRMFDDDWVGILLDPYLDNKFAYGFVVNPLGIQGDIVMAANSNEDPNFDTIWYSAAMIFKDGWSAEIAIPFKSLRFKESKNQTWNLHVLRQRSRNSKFIYSLKKISRDDPCLICQSIKLKGFAGISSGKNFDILPYVLANQTGYVEDTGYSHYNFKNFPVKGTGGINFKYSFSSNLLFEMTLNPDFSQVESDATQIDVNSNFAIFYPEKRPFFLEGSSILDLDENIIYTRMINDLVAGSKITGKIGGISFGYIGGLDDHSPFILPLEEQSDVVETNIRSWSDIVRFKKDISSDSFIGGVFTHREFQNAYNRIIGIDGNIRFLNEYYLFFQTIKSWTKELNDPSLYNNNKKLIENFDAAFNGESYDGKSIIIGIRRRARHYNFNISFKDFSPTFRADNGFIVSNNYRLYTTRHELVFRPNNKYMDSIEFSIKYFKKYNYDNILKEAEIFPGLFVALKKQFYIFTGFSHKTEKYNNVLFEGFNRFLIKISSNFSQKVNGEIFLLNGEIINRDLENTILGKGFEFYGSINIKITPQLITEFRLQKAKLINPLNEEIIFNGYIFRNITNYQFNKNLFFRLITQYDKFSKLLSIEPLLTYRINAFSIFYVGYSSYLEDIEDNNDYIQTNRQFFIKLQYLWRI